MTQKVVSAFLMENLLAHALQKVEKCFTECQ